MAEERRNLYRILHVQPEAPLEVIRASWRTLMSTLRAHPDLGGDAEAAARINAAYAVLSDPERRSAYDRSLLGPKPAATPRGATAKAVPARPLPDPSAWLADRVCPFCCHPLPQVLAAQSRCDSCASPLFKLPASDRSELFGRRRAPRNPRPMNATLRWPGQAADRIGRLRDLSLSGLSVSSPEAVPERTPLRVVTEGFDAVAVVVGCRRQGGGWVLHGQLLTLQMLRSQGVFVSARA